MKKIFSTVAMAIVAFTAVVSMSSCQNDSPSSFNAAPQVDFTQNMTPVEQANKTNANDDYKYQAFITKDVFKLYDVDITRTCAAVTKTYSFSEALMEKDMMTTGLDYFQAAAGTKVNVVAKFTLKENYKDILAEILKEKGENADLVLDAYPQFDCPINSLKGEYMRQDAGGKGVEVKNVEKDALETLAKQFSQNLTVNMNM